MSTYLPSTDCAMLFASIAKSDEAAYQALFNKYREMVYAVALKWVKSSYLSEEITQDVFISIWVSRARLEMVKDPQAYLFTIVYNKISRCLRKESNKSKIMQGYSQLIREYTNETDEAICANETSRIIDRAIDQLPPHRKNIFKLNRQEGRDYEAIGEMLHLSPHTVKSHLMKAVKYVRLYVKEHALLILFFNSLFF